VPLPADGHVHSQWSWDAEAGSMEASCAEAVRLGLPAIAFTEHLDHTAWSISDDYRTLVGAHPPATLADADGLVVVPPFDVEGYLAEIARCRDLFPELRVLAGLEVGEPHWHAEAVAALLAAGEFDRVLGSLHCLPEAGTFLEPYDLLTRRDPDRLIRDYLAEIAELVSGSDVFTSLAHIDYPVRYWPADGPPFEPKDFEDELRHALRATATAGRALEINTVLPLHETILRWWYDEGGQAVTFGSDAHEPSVVANRFADAATMAEACGFRPAHDLAAPWRRA
jgi:histidinol-phosphatase (PHP family)